MPSDPATAPIIDFNAEPAVVRAVVEAERLTYGHLYNPAFATEISLIDPLPHQRIAVYDHLLKQNRLRFLLADDAGAGKTIMAGLYLRERLARRLLRRVLIVVPAGLLGNWRRELSTLFALDFRIVKGGEAKRRNPFVGDDSDRLIISVDTLAGPNVFARLQAPEVVPYDLAIFDEAHKLAADQDPDAASGLRTTDRYLLAEALAGVGGANPRWHLEWACTHLLLLTATPHMGKEYPYYCLWRLLEPTVLPTYDAFTRRTPEWRAEHFIRRTKEEMVKLDGSPLYPVRECHTLSFDLNADGENEQQLYDETTKYIERYYNLARVLNRAAVRFAMSVFQRRLASSTYAILCSFRNRLKKLDDLIARMHAGDLTEDELRRLAAAADETDDPLDTKTGDEEQPEGDREENEVAEDTALGSVAARNLGELIAERTEVARLLALAERVHAKGTESKFEKLREHLTDPAFRDQKVLLFTEHRDTLTFLVKRLEALGLGNEIATIHGGMPFEEREEQVAQFKKPVEEGGARWLVATDAAGEGINLQFCWLMVNYDIPWNPARLEQRMGRIHRYGQKRDTVVILNLIAGKTREGRVLFTLLTKLDAIRKSLNSDKVFDVIGRIFEGRSLREVMASLVSPGGDADAEVRKLDGTLTKSQIEALAAKEHRLFGDGGDVKRHLGQMREAMEIEALRRLMPGHVAHFLVHAAPILGMSVEGDPDRVFRLQETAPGAMASTRAVLGRYPEPLQDKLTVHRPKPGEAVFVHPGEAVYEHLRMTLLAEHDADALRGGVFVDPTTDTPYLVHVGRADVVRLADPAIPALARDEVLESRFFAVRQAQDGTCSLDALEHLLLLRPDRGGSRPPDWPPTEAFVAIADAWVEGSLMADAVEAQRQGRRDALVERRAAVVAGFGQLEADLIQRFKRLKEKAEDGNNAAKAALAQTRARMQAVARRKGASIAAIEREPELITAGNVDWVAHALIVPSFAPEDGQQYDALVEQEAMRQVIAHEMACGATVHDVHTPELARLAGLVDWPGFDIQSIRPGGERRCIEVKGRARQGDVEVSANEWIAAATHGPAYWLYAVFDCATSSPRLVRVRDPFSALIGRTATIRIDDASILAAADRSS